MTNSTATQLVDAALATLIEDGFAGATSRAIARRARVNQALVFYHHGSVDSLLLAALDRTSQSRLEAYRSAVGAAATLEQALAEMRRLHEEDLASGHMTVVSQMIAGSVSRPAIAADVLARFEPWLAFAEGQIARFLGDLVPAKDAAYAVVTFYLGVNLLSHLDTDHARTAALLERLLEAAPLLGALSAAAREP